MPKEDLSEDCGGYQQGVKEGSQNRVHLFEDLIAEGLLKKDPVDPIRASINELTDDPSKVKGEPEYERSHFKDAMVGGRRELDGRCVLGTTRMPCRTINPPRVIPGISWWIVTGTRIWGLPQTVRQDGVGSVFAGNDAFVMNTHMLDEAMYGTDAAREILANHGKRNANLKGDMRRGMPENFHRNGSPSNNLTDKWVYHPYTADLRTHGTASPIMRLVQGNVFALPHEAGHMATLDGWRSMPKGD